ncbi:MAG: response regulator transcription factor [Clostridia bacterium]
MPKKVLIVDDEPNIVELERYYLEQNGFITEVAMNGKDALAMINAEDWQLVLLDIMLPGMDGLEICKEVRKKSGVPIILVSAKSEELDKILGLEFGADDYITKPFSPRELVARVKAVLRRFEGREHGALDETVKKKIVRRDVELLPDYHEAYLQGQRLELTMTEYQILALLMESPGRVFTRDNLLTSIWGGDYFGDNRTVDVHIRHLREKLMEIAVNEEYIQTVRGLGYKFKE